MIYSNFLKQLALRLHLLHLLTVLKLVFKKLIQTDLKINLKNKKMCFYRQSSLKYLTFTYEVKVLLEIFY